MKIQMAILWMLLLTIPCQAQWQPEVHGQSSPESIMADSSGNRILVSMFDNGGIWLTNDGGNSWQQINDRLSAMPNTQFLKSIPCCRFIAVGAAADTMILNTYQYSLGRHGEGYYSFEYHSMDGGLSWDSFTPDIASIWPDSVDGFSFGGDQTLVIPDCSYYARQSGFCISHDDGESWDFVDVSPWECGIKSVLFDQTQPDTVYMFGHWGFRCAWVS
ncbi:MAG TPA: hypothetical protein ENH10_03380 [Bacteroidetes bacterium]|nr:hypothetical protein BMS3Bbin04_01707 [bacterium BMS3Bbin04]HDO65058.1 hypothetical protein [Bacteroidota bacterium]HEX04183.1 hypothetical protein [Bacteroidota bacterium]